MTMEEILKALNIDKLDESQQTDIKEKLNTMIDVKARERADTLLGEEKEQLVEDYEGKFEEYKNDITSKFSNFVDTVLDEELHIPEKVTEYARRGELYSDLIEQFKIRLALDEGILDDEVKDLLSDAKAEIQNLRDQVNTLMAEKLEVDTDARKMAAELYLREKCEGLSEDHKKRVLAILSDIYDKEEIDRKFQIVVDNILQEQDDEEGDSNGDDKDKNGNGKTKCVCPKCGKKIEVEGECADSKCPDDDTTLKPAKAEESKGKGKTEVGDGTVLDEADTSPFGEQKKKWVSLLRK